MNIVLDISVLLINMNVVKTIAVIGKDLNVMVHVGIAMTIKYPHQMENTVKNLDVVPIQKLAEMVNVYNVKPMKNLHMIKSNAKKLAA